MDSQQKEIDLQKVVEVLKVNRKGIAKFTGLITLLAIIYCIFATPIFTAKVLINPPKLSDAGTTMNHVLNGLSDLATGGSFLSQKTDADIAISILKTAHVSDMLIKRFNLQELYEAVDIELTRKALSGHVNFIPDIKSGFLEIDVDDKDPKLAAEMANYYVIALGQTISDIANNKAKSRYQFYTTQTAQAQQSLEQAESAIKEFAQKNGIIAGNQAQVIAGIATQLQAQLVVYQAQLQAMGAYASPDNPDYKALQAQINGIRQQLMQLNPQQSGDNFAIPANLAPELSQQYIRLMREFAVRETVYKILLNQLEANKFDHLIEQAPTPIQVVDTAQVPLHKSKPKRLFIIVFSILFSILFSSLFFILKNLTT